MFKTAKYTNENAAARPMKAINPLGSIALRDSTNMITNLNEKNVLLDSPQDSKESLPPPFIYINEDSNSKAQQQPNTNSFTSSKYNTPAKLASQPAQNNQQKNKKIYDDDLVNFGQSPYGRGTQSRGRTPAHQENTERQPSNLSSDRRSRSGEEVPNITPRTKLNQLRMERREEKATDFEIKITDVKIQEMQKELRSMHKQQNVSTITQMEKTGHQMKASLIKIRSISNTREGNEQNVNPNISALPEVPEPVKIIPKKQVQLLKLVQTEKILIKANNGSDLKQRISKMEEEHEKETEETQAKISAIESKLPLEKRLVEQMWQVRRNAYKEIGNIFVESKNTGKSCESYVSWISYMINDSNLIALVEGLNTMSLYIQHAKNIGLILGFVPDLLDKVPVNKSQFQDIVTKILFELVKKGQGKTVSSELILRINTRKTTRISLFSVNCLSKILESDQHDDIDLMQSFKASLFTLSKNQREMRGPAIKLLQTIFELVDDSLDVFINKASEGSKSSVLKELGDVLKNTVKRKKNNKMILFPGCSENSEINQNEADKNNNAGSIKILKVIQTGNQSQETVNLLDYIDEEIFKIMYLTKAEEKKVKIEEMNNALTKLKDKSCKIEKNDYQPLINILCNLLEDTNTFLQLEVFKSFQILSAILKKDFNSFKPKSVVSKLLDRLKETKSQVISQIETTIKEMLDNESLTPENLVDSVMQKISHSKNPKIRQQSLQLLINKINSKENALVSTIQQQFTPVIAPKLLNIIQRDASAGVRDAAIQFLTKLKISCPEATEIDTVISKLPKGRIQAIYAKVKSETQSSKTPRSANCVEPNCQNIKRSKSELTIIPVQCSDDTTPKADDAAKLMKAAESGNCANLMTVLNAISSSESMRQHILYCLVYFLTKGSDQTKLTETEAIMLSEYINKLLSAGNTTEQELDYQISCGIVLGSLIGEQHSQAKYSTIILSFQAKEFEYFLLALRKVLYTFKYSDDKDTTQNAGMHAYKLVADWLYYYCNQMTTNEIEQIISSLSIKMGFKAEFVSYMEKAKNRVRNKMNHKTEEKEIHEAIANASAVAMNLKMPTPRGHQRSAVKGTPTPRHASRTHQQLQQIADGLTNKDEATHKKAIEELNHLLNETSKQKNGALVLYAPFMILQDIVEGLCKMPNLLDESVRLLLKLRAYISADESSKLMKPIMQNLTDFTQIENTKKQSVYKLLTFWGKDTPKKEITATMNDIFTGCSFRYDSGANRFIVQLGALLHWLNAEILGEIFSTEDIEPILTYVIRGTKCIHSVSRECSTILQRCFLVFGEKKTNLWIEDILGQTPNLFHIFTEWRESILKKHNEAGASKNYEKATLPQMIAQLANLSSSDSKHLSFDSGSYTPKESPNKPIEGNQQQEKEKAILKSSLSGYSPIDKNESSPDFRGSQRNVENQEANNQKNNPHPFSEETKKEVPLLEKDKAGTTANLFQTLQVTSPRFGSEIVAQAQQKVDTPLSIQELSIDKPEEEKEEQPTVSEFQALSPFSVFFIID